MKPAGKMKGFGGQLRQQMQQAMLSRSMQGQDLSGFSGNMAMQPYQASQNPYGLTHPAMGSVAPIANNGMGIQGVVTNNLGRGGFLPIPQWGRRGR